MFKPVGIAIAAFSSVVFLGETLHVGRYTLISKIFFVMLFTGTTGLCYEIIIGAVIIVIGFYSVLWAQSKEKNAKGLEVDRVSSPSAQASPLLESHEDESNVLEIFFYQSIVLFCNAALQQFMQKLEWSSIFIILSVLFIHDQMHRKRMAPQETRQLVPCKRSTFTFQSTVHIDHPFSTVGYYFPSLNGFLRATSRVSYRKCYRPG
ncbi:WAT1-related protein, partial [Mucuna pruriens]